MFRQIRSDEGSHTLTQTCTSVWVNVATSIYQRTSVHYGYMRTLTCVLNSTLNECVHWQTNCLSLECQNGQVVEDVIFEWTLQAFTVTIWPGCFVTPSKNVVRALEWIQSAVPAEIIVYYNSFTIDFVLCCSQSTSLVAVLFDNILMQVLDVNSSQCPVLMNEYEN